MIMRKHRSVIVCRLQRDMSLPNLLDGCELVGRSEQDSLLCAMLDFARGKLKVVK